MQLQEIDDAAPAVGGDVVEPRGDDVHDFAVGWHLLGDQLCGQLDQHDGGRFQRLQESGRQADGDAIVLPESLAMAGADRDLARRQAIVPRADIAPQLPRCRLLADMAAGIDIADAAARRQADVPDPARRLGGRDGVRGHGRVGAVVGHLHRQRGIAEQNVAAVLETHAQRLAQQQGREAGAVDEQVALRFRRPGGCKAVMSPFSLWLTVCTSASTWRTPSFTVQCFCRKGANFAGVQMIGVVGHGLIFRRGDGLGRQPVIAQRPCGETASQKLRPWLAASQCGARFTWVNPCGSIRGW